MHSASITQFHTTVGIQEHVCRIFTRNSDPEVVRRTQEAARKYVEIKFGGRVEMATPIKRPCSHLANLPNGSQATGGLQRDQSKSRKRNLNAVLDAVELS